MIRRFLILAANDPRPSARQIIFCDGAGGGLYCAETDLELSHWRPNRTPPEYRADSSTEICFRFVDAPRAGDWTLAVNNHLDVDGILSLYVLVHSEQALAERRTIIEAAEMGDFWGWGGPHAQRLFQGLTRLMNAGSDRGVSTTAIYEEAFALVPRLIAGDGREAAEAEISLDPLRQSVALVEGQAVRRVEHGRRFAQYVVPRAIAVNQLDAALYVPGFNEAISTKALVWPQARAKWDSERVCLVSVDAEAGWHHDLWFPGYLWADTANRWTIPGMRFRDGMELYDLNHPGLSAGVQQLQRHEPARGTWALGDGASPFNTQIAGIFPVVLRFVDEPGRPAPSRLDPAEVAAHLHPAFAET